MQLDSLIGAILIQARGCSDMLAVDALRRSAIQLCEQTQAWRETITQQAKTQDVDLDIPAHSRAAAIRRVFVGEDEILPMAPDNINPFAASSTPRGYFRVSENVLRLIPAPDAPVTLTVEAVLAPTYTANTIPDDLADRCRMALIWGALAYLLAIPGQTWTQPELAGAYLHMFEQEAAKVSLQDVKGRVRATLRSRASFF